MRHELQVANMVLGRILACNDLSIRLPAMRRARPLLFVHVPSYRSEELLADSARLAQDCCEGVVGRWRGVGPLGLGGGGFSVGADGREAVGGYVAEGRGGGAGVAG